MPYKECVTQSKGHTELLLLLLMLLEKLVCHMHAFMYTIHFFFHAALKWIAC